LSKWHSWSEMASQYKTDEVALISAKESAEMAKKASAKKSNVDKNKEIVACELLASMISSTKYAAKEVEKKLIYDLGTFSGAELDSLSGQERQVAGLKQKHSNREIAEMLGISTQHVQTVHRRCVNKLKRIHSLNNRDIPLGLSRQQERIYVMHFKEKRNAAQIAKKLKISVAMVHKQICAIRDVK